VVDLRDSDSKAFCSIIEIDFAKETAMTLENKILIKVALMPVKDTCLVRLFKFCYYDFCNLSGILFRGPLEHQSLLVFRSQKLP
tara:strand:+ start:331 stop:582 length:252 start_codon:yes stop_codon:yes gene_type:complete